MTTCKACGTALYDDIWCPRCGYGDEFFDGEPAYHAPSAFVEQKRVEREERKLRDATLKAQAAHEERAEKRAARSAFEEVKR